MAAYTPQLLRLIINLGRKFPALWDDILKKPSKNSVLPSGSTICLNRETAILRKAGRSYCLNTISTSVKGSARQDWVVD